MDASFRQGKEEDSHLSIVECRRRSKVQDVTWIEQLATKKTSLGADRLIAVSSSGFSKDCWTLAEHHGVELRELTELKPKDVCKTLAIDLVLFWFRRCALHSVGINKRRFDASDAVTSAQECDFMLLKDWDPAEKTFRNIEEDHRFSLNDLWLQLQDATDPFVGVNKNESPVVRNASFPFERDVEMKVGEGTVSVSAVVLELMFWLEAEWVSAIDAVRLQYKNQTGKIERVEFGTKSQPGRWLHLQSDEAGALSVSVK